MGERACFGLGGVLTGEVLGAWLGGSAACSTAR
jgi:hypothetical protein